MGEGWKRGLKQTVGERMTETQTTKPVSMVSPSGKGSLGVISTRHNFSCNVIGWLVLLSLPSHPRLDSQENIDFMSVLYTGVVCIGTDQRITRQTRCPKSLKITFKDRRGSFI